MKKVKNKIKKIGWGFGGCNMNCRHCYNASTKNMIKHSYKKLKVIADKICLENITDINFGTGEFLINPNALKIAEYIKDKYPQVALGLTSNGYSVINMQVSALKKLFHDIDISIDFPSKKKHNLFRKHNKAWDWAIQALDICRHNNIERSIVTCVNSETTDEDILNLLFLARRYNASLRINWFRPTGRGNKNLCITALRFWKIIYLLSKNAIFEGLSDPILEAVILDKQESGHCSCGWTSARIQQDLSVTPCVFLKGKRWDSGNILENSLDEIYDHPNFQVIRYRQVEKCKDCKYLNACQGGCGSRAYLQEGGLHARDAYCPLKNKRIKELIKKIKENIKIENSNKVHHGYLCTLIIK